MKKYLYIILFVLCGMLMACTDTTEIWPAEDADPAKIELSSTKLIFDADGGSAAVIVAANTDGWDYVASDDWFTVEQKNDNTLEVTVAVNVRPELLSGTLTVSGEKGGVKASADVELVQRTDRSVNLSAEGTSNCYLAKTNKAYKFDARIKGNGAGDGKSTYIQNYGIEISDIAYADLLWEACNDADKTMSREIIDGAPIYRDGYIAFSTGRAQGNAVIAARDVSGNILWSWHIWVLDDEIQVRPHLNKEDNVISQIMDRNLGAMNNVPMDVNNRGMFYQWGRKDPFPPARSPYTPRFYDNPEGNRPNDEVGNGSGTWNFYTVAPPVDEAPGNIPYALQNPMKFLTYYYSDVYEWYCMTKDVNVINSGLWAEEKTMFDPCPVGYKVPGKDTWGIPAGNQQITIGGNQEEYDENGENPIYSWNVFKDCGRTWKYTGDFYPAAGTVTITSNNTHANTSIYGFYWTSHNYTPTGRFYRVDFTASWAQYFSASAIFSAQIRCVKE